MTLRRRINQLEARAPGLSGAETAEAAAEFTRRIAAMCARIEATGDTADKPGASPAVRYCCALLRGDAEMAQAIINRATGGMA